MIEKNAESTAFAVTATYEYDAFGGLVSGTGGEADSNAFRYNGQYTDEETGLIYLRNRYYDPETGRFTQEDLYWNPNNMIYGDQQFEDGEVRIPDYSAIAQSVNLYIYCMSDPVNGVDPIGMVTNERFGSADYAAEDWSWNYFATVDYTLYEQMSIIYKVENYMGDVYYTYGYALYNIRDENPHVVYYQDVLNLGVEIPNGYSATPVAIVHAHPSLYDVSNTDLELLDNTILLAVYTAAYAGYNTYDLNKTYKDGYGHNGYNVVANGTYKALPFNRSQELYYKFRDSWKLHQQSNDIYGCRYREWPRTRGDDW